MTADETNGLLTRSKQLLEDLNLDEHPLTKFTTGDKNHVGDDYFLGSGDKVRYFLEEDAVDANGNLTREKHKSVNKIGHGELVQESLIINAWVTDRFSALHELDPSFRKVTLENDRLQALVRDLKFHQDPVGMYFDGEHVRYWTNLHALQPFSL